MLSPETVPLTRKEWPSCIYMPSVLAIMDRYTSIATKYAHFAAFVYPDGSWEVNDEQHNEAMRQALVAAVGQETNTPAWGTRLAGYLGSAGYLSVHGTPCMVTIRFWDKFIDELDDTDRVLVTPVASLRRCDAPLPNPLPVTVAFQRRLTTIHRSRAVDALRQCLGAIHEGHLGSPVCGRLANPNVELYPDRIRFEIDVDAIGQRGVNWIVLSMLHLASEVAIPVISFGDDVAVRNLRGEPRKAPERIVLSV